MISSDIEGYPDSNAERSFARNGIFSIKFKSWLSGSIAYELRMAKT
jgi:hypothetical protein